MERLSARERERAAAPILPRNSRLGDRTQAELDAIADEFNGRLDKPSAG